jgi:anti-sigma B factor antagonist
VKVRKVPAQVVPPLVADHRRVGPRHVVELAGEIDISTIDGVRDAYDHALAGPCRELWVDLSEVEFMDSTGIAALLDLRRRAEDDREVVVICPAGAVRRLLELTGLDQLLVVHRSRSAADHAA